MTYGIFATDLTPTCPNRQDLSFAPQVIGLDARLAGPLPEVDTAEIDRVWDEMQRQYGAEALPHWIAYKQARPDVQARNRAEAVQQLMHCLPHLEHARMALLRLESGLGDALRHGSQEAGRIANAIHALVAMETV